MTKQDVPPGVITFGENTNCNLDKCPVEWSIYGFRPSLAANITLFALFIAIGVVQIFLGVRWKSWWFMMGMVIGCAGEAIGYWGRIMLYKNPFSYEGFLIQIVCLIFSPVFYTASVYVTLSKTIVYLAPELSRFKPSLFYWIFIPFDLLCLVLQAAGGAISTDANSDPQLGINISMAGLILQVVVLFAFAVCFADYMIRYVRSGRSSGFGWRLKAFFFGLTAATLLIFVRCVFRVAELKDGYEGHLIREEIPFIILEGVLVVLAAAFLCIGHPGLVFGKTKSRKTSRDIEGSDLSSAQRF